MEAFRRRWSLPGLLIPAEVLLSKAWADSTSKRYRSAWHKCMRCCLLRGLDPMVAGVIPILNYLAELASDGLAYRSINAVHSAISAAHCPVDGSPVGEHPFVCRLLQGICLSLPPEPRYSVLWDVNLVLNLFLSWQANKYLSLKEFSAKLAMLLCLISCRRVSDVRALDVSARVFSPEGVTFTVGRRTKSLSRTISYPAFFDVPKLCGAVPQGLREYDSRTLPSGRAATYCPSKAS